MLKQNDNCEIPDRSENPYLETIPTKKQAGKGEYTLTTEIRPVGTLDYENDKFKIEIQIRINMSKIDELHQQFSEYGKNAREWVRKCVLMLPDIEKFEVWKKKGFGSIFEYAAKLVGMSRGQVDDALRILHRIEDKPALIKIVEMKGINAVRPVATIATKETAGFWAKKAADLSRHELEAYVRSSRTLVDTEEFHQNMLCDLNKTAKITLELNPDLAAKFQKFCNGNWNEFMQKLLDLYEENLLKELQRQKPDKKVTKSKYKAKALNAYIHKRAHGKCEFPNCNKPHKHLHHIDRFSSKREHDPDRIIALCVAHHQLAHRGLIEENADFSRWKIRKEVDLTNLNRFIDDKVQFHRRT